jgi:hypothetical protein
MLAVIASAGWLIALVSFWGESWATGGRIVGALLGLVFGAIGLHWAHEREMTAKHGPIDGGVIRSRADADEDWEVGRS